MAGPVKFRRQFIDELYQQLFIRAVAYFFPQQTLVRSPGLDPDASESLELNDRGAGVLEVRWLGARYILSRERRPFTEGETKLLTSIGQVLSTRYELLFRSDLAAQALNIFRGVPEDRYVSAFLDPSPYLREQDLLNSDDRIAEAIEVLRSASLMTYENRRIATGALLFGSHPDPCHPLPPLPEGAVQYSSPLTSVRSFQRICDGLQTVALVDRAGYLVELVEVREWARPFEDMQLPVPVAARYAAHARATLCGGHVFLVLTDNGEIKVFAGGAQVFNFLDGRWRLTDSAARYAAWTAAVGDAKLADVIFTAALNLAEDRRGCLFTILDHPDGAASLLSPGDLVANGPAASAPGSKQQLHYLLRGKRVVDLPAAVLESVARIDGSIVLNRAADLIAFGAILRTPPLAPSSSSPAEGARTTAAIGASRFGKVLKVSEDGQISFYENGSCVWEL